MPFLVKFTQGARRDLRAIFDYIAQNESDASAEHVVRGIIRAALALQDFPQRGAHPPELLRLGKREYRLVYFKPYRILCRIRGDTVHIAVVADGRRDMASLLARRLRQLRNT